eukprot:2304433-Rhodomonas_salina.2
MAGSGSAALAELASDGLDKLPLRLAVVQLGSSSSVVLPCNVTVSQAQQFLYDPTGYMLGVGFVPRLLAATKMDSTLY